MHGLHVGLGLSSDQPEGDRISGVPCISFYSADLIGSEYRIFYVGCDGDGLIYLAFPDEDTVKIFDGETWLSVNVNCPLSLATDTRGKVWVGQGDGLGYFHKNELNQISFKSFELEYGPDDLTHYDIAFCTDYGVRLGNARTVLEIDTRSEKTDVNIVRALPDETFVSFESANIGSLLGEKRRPYKIVDGERIAVLNSDEIDERIDCTITLEDGKTVFVTDGFANFMTESAGKLIPFSEKFVASRKDLDFHWIMPIHGNRLGLAESSAFTCFSPDGRIIYSIDNNTGVSGQIRRFGSFRDGRSWITTNDGFAILNDMPGVDSWPILTGRRPATFELEIFNNSILIATDQGLFEFSKGEIENAWAGAVQKRLEYPSSAIVNIDQRIVAATSSGIFEFGEGGTKRKLADGQFFDIFADSIDGKTTIFAGDQHANLEVYHYNSDAMKLVQTAKLPGDGWIEHRFSKNVFLFSHFNNQLSLIDFSNGISNPPEFHLVEDRLGVWTFFTIRDQAHVTTENGVYAVNFNNSKLKFVESKIFKDVLRSKSGLAIKKVIDCGKRGVALFDENHDLYFHRWDGEKIAATPDKRIQFGYPFSVGNMIWDPNNECLWTVKKRELMRFNIDSIAPVAVNSLVSIRMDSAELLESKDSSGNLAIGPWGGIEFQFGMPGHFCLSDKEIEYQYRLEGNDNDWSPWSNSTHKEYTNLAGGNYRFHVRARTPDGAIQESSSTTFSVATPWYYQPWASVLLVASLLGLIYLASVFHTNNLKIANERMEKLVEQRTKEIESKSKEVLEKSALLHAKEIKSEAERLESFDTLVAGIAHDFNNLLTVISANNELISLHGDEEARQFAENTSEAIQSAIELCGEMSAFSDKSPASLKAVDIVNAVRGMNDTLGLSVPDGVEFDCQLPDTKLNSLADINQLKRALLNLVVNAGEAARSKVTVQVLEKVLKEDDLINARFVGNLPAAGMFHCIEVIDDGSGLRENVLNRMFDPFYSTKEFGRGLGLAIVLKIIGRHRGVVFVYSSLDGTMFCVCLPKTDQQPVQIDKPHMTTKLPKLDILVVDDDVSVLRSVECLLELQNHRVKTAESPIRGLQVIGDCKPLDLLIVDVAMPEMSGPEMALQVFELRPELPILMVSGFNETLLQEEVLNRENVAFLAKPFTMNQFNEKIASLLQYKTGGYRTTNA